MIPRLKQLQEIKTLLSQYPIVAILGPRQVGKTTLARLVASAWKTSSWFDLENDEDLAKLSEPMTGLKHLHGLVVLDEIQRRPELFPTLRVLVDQKKISQRFLILGSASPSLLRQSSESLAGRITYHTLNGFSLDEIGISGTERLWLRGGYPLSYLSRINSTSFKWRKDFIKTFLERDIPQFQISIPAETMRRFWIMLTHYHGQIWNSSEFARSFGVSDMTIRRYLDLLSSTFMIRQLSPWFENLGKRLVKSPKIYFQDSGILHVLMGIETMEQLMENPRMGTSWEGFVLNAIIQRIEVDREECYFWATHNGAEMDLLVVRGKTKLGFEIKRSEAPSLTPSMRIAMKDLKLDHLYVIHAGKENYPLGERIEAVAFQSFHKKIKPF